jgi:hypothetical protein
MGSCASTRLFLFLCVSLQVLLAWGLARGTSIVPKSSLVPRLAENLAAINVALTADDVAVLSKLNLNLRFNDPVNFWGMNHVACACVRLRSGDVQGCAGVSRGVRV